MRSDQERSALIDILHNIALAEEFLRDQTFDKFCEDLMRVYAVTRCLEIISEASRRLSDALKQRHPDIAWRVWPERETSTAMITRMLRHRTSGTPCRSPCRRCAWSSRRSSVSGEC